jgi:CubicO group peptidase (beta-lactamase class C family)
MTPGEHSVIQGVCDSRFAAVREAFEENFKGRNEIGASVGVVFQGRLVVDLWGGYVDRNKEVPWKRDTLVNVFSTTKGVTAICAHRLMERGLLDPQAPVAKYWPQFAAVGKEHIPVGWLLNHRAGLPAVRRNLPNESLYDWKLMTDTLAAEEPWWVPGERHGYHAVTFGWLLGEVIRRVSGRSVGTYFREELGVPLNLDFHIGLSPTEQARVARVSSPRMPPEDEDGKRLMEALVSKPHGIVARAFTNPFSIINGVNTSAWREAEIPSANGHGTARALARLYGALALGGTIDGVRVLGPETIRNCFREESYGTDEILQAVTRFGPGFMLSQDRPGASYGPGLNSFGHPGAGGSVAFADPEAGVGFAYVMNRMGPYVLIDPRATALIDAVYR